MFNIDELNILEGLLNEEIIEYLRSGYGLDNEYVIHMRNILKKLGLKEYYDFEKWRDD